MEENNCTSITESTIDNCPQNENVVSQTGMMDSENVDVGNVADGTPEKKEHTRSKMAILFVLGFFAILFLVVFVPF